MFITFEGCEGSGKSTQSRMLFDHLKSQGKEAILTREPGGTEASERFREILLDKHLHLEAQTQLLLHTAARVEHVTQVILPALKDGAIVICDRFIDSTVAYQHYGNGVDVDLIEFLHQKCVHNLMPDKTFILDIDFDEMSIRVKNRGGASDRYESMALDFHKKVIAGFREIAALNKDRCSLIHSSPNKAETFKSIMEYL